MARVTKDQYIKAYEKAVSVYKGECTRIGGAKYLHEKYGINKSTADEFINKYRCMREGKSFSRGASIEAIAYFLNEIHTDNDDDALLTAIRSVYLHIKQSKSSMPGLRRMLEEFEQKVPSSLDTLADEEHKKVVESLKLSSEERRKRLATASKIPEKEYIRVARFKRNSDVVAEVLKRAEGICEICKNPAPFIRKSDSEPYLEVHHKVRLADGGEDSVENAIAICPNCHRNEHYGVSK